MADIESQQNTSDLTMTRGGRGGIRICSLVLDPEKKSLEAGVMAMLRDDVAG